MAADSFFRQGFQVFIMKSNTCWMSMMALTIAFPDTHITSSMVESAFEWGEQGDDFAQIQ